MEEVPSMMAP
jgi:hypothetical protein